MLEDNEDAPARNPDGSLKEAWEMPDQFVFSPSGDTPALPAIPSPPTPTPPKRNDGRPTRDVNRDKYKAAIAQERAPTITPPPPARTLKRSAPLVLSDNEVEHDEEGVSSSKHGGQHSKKNPVSYWKWT